ncbi:hypothetical protein FO488_05310 [Geobacter sp. FeAm09]|uniref:hypothetical protein n=1 Tax=Geobacter sp. FeAm09 TaxID=2597769 RepID=UPI0011EF921B|nr:hypothetical protein [Geobacter sp. FeAm09]QEM67627.1 hypothetical protein FO488_05310 [Geobacter sp. FeAm09]
MKNSDMMPRAAQAMRIALACCLLAMTAGCSGGLALVGSLDTETETWANSVVSREPQGPEELAVCNAAKSRKAVSSGGITAVFLAGDHAHQIVIAVAGSGQEVDEMTPKKLTNYLVVDGKIRAYSKPVMAPSPDVDYEKTVYSAATGALSPAGFSVIIYSRPTRDLTIKGTRKTGCTFKVTVLDGFDSAGKVLSERSVNICYDNLP